jgi:transposase
MERDLLERYLNEDLSLTEIGALVNRDPSTVGYWVKRYGLTPNGQRKHASRGALERELLTTLADRGMTIAEIASTLDRSPATVRYWLGKYGLRTKGRRGPRPAVAREVVEQAIHDGRKEVTAVCPTHGEGAFVIENSGRVRCRLCRMERVSVRRRKVKRLLIEEAGGRCIRCGYDRFVGALHFHHVDPSLKRFGVSRKGATIAIDALRQEASKCIVLCANCHAEVEHGGASLALK